MKKVVIVKCQMISNQNLCPGDAKCMVAFMRREGEFERYKNEDAHIIGIVDCGGCEGNKNRVVCSLALLKLQLAALNEKPDVVHVGTCIMKFCKRKDDLIAAIKEKAGVEVVEGTHSYAPPTIFGS
ncbi:MAG: putative metal-binding protein [Thermodesulfobacterium sp.]|uniref:Metal-binding protein n=1 Tax=Candidatus Thermodesulfobacterium syntrophicum TaxID=3060442 RepID=A0AAE3P3R8_9BACT|nr:CGGC domain-containing protein [Thermodesulfobacterium sp.]MDF2953393.1 putative metal-binding protein [Candidatus Thermodesulfobacterium syntrophicum]